jgi:hypothetical protein
MELQWIGFTFGLIGMILWAANVSWSRCAGVFWFIGSACWIVVGWNQGSTALLLRDLVNLVIFAVGIWRWMWKGSG